MPRIVEIEPGLIAIRSKPLEVLRAVALGSFMVGVFVASVPFWYPMDEDDAAGIVLLGLFPMALGGYGSLAWSEKYLDADRRSIAEVSGLRPFATRLLLLGEIAERSVDEFDHLRVTSLFRAGWGVLLGRPLSAELREELASGKRDWAPGDLLLVSGLSRGEARHFARVVGNMLRLPVLDRKGCDLWSPSSASDSNLRDTYQEKPV